MLGVIPPAQAAAKAGKKAVAVPQHVKLMGVIHICADGPCLIDIRGAQPDGRRDGRLEIPKSSEAHI